MNTDEVKDYVTEHFPEASVEKIEWIDDSSANVLFSSDSAATHALSSLAAQDIHDISQLPMRKLNLAKPFSRKPEVALQVRLAVTSDKKQAGAASRSRFYLLNPRYDPEERRRRNDSRKYRERDRDSYSHRREFEDQFDVSLYDDDEATLATRAAHSRPRRKRSHTPETYQANRERNSHRNDNRSKELFPGVLDNRKGSHRARSASPMRDGGGDRDVGEIWAGGSAAHNHDTARTNKKRPSRSNPSRELFPESSAAGAGRLGDNVEDTATLLAKGIMLPLMDESSDAPVFVSQRLEDRITVPGREASASRVSSVGDRPGSGFNIRGTASQRGTGQGFAIKGSANKSAKELFPEKLGINSEKELFADRLEGRSRQRQRAGDLFD